jgi:hypothetical protein
MDTYYTGKHCANPHCGRLLTVKDGDTPRVYNRRRHCNSSCASRARVAVDSIPHGTRFGYPKCRLRPAGPCDPCTAAQIRHLAESGRKQQQAVYDAAVRELVSRYPQELNDLITKELSA